MKNKKITIYDVAREAGVSLATVSRVLNKSAKVAPEKERMVLDVIERLNYRPNEVARGLARKRSTTVGVLVPEIGRLSVAEMLSGILDTANMEMYKYSTLIKSYASDLDLFKKYWEDLLSNQVDGILVMFDYITDEIQEMIENSPVPVVVFASATDSETLARVSIDYEQAFYDVTKYFLDNGNDDVLFCTRNYTSALEVQKRGYVRAFSESGRPVNEENILRVYRSYEENYEFAKEYLTTKKPQAIASTSDSAAIAFMNAALDLGIKIPEELEIISFSNTKTSQMVRPGLTSVSYPIYKIGVFSMRLLTKIMRNETSDENKFIEAHEIIWRQSTRKQK